MNKKQEKLFEVTKELNAELKEHIRLVLVTTCLDEGDLIQYPRKSGHELGWKCIAGCLQLHTHPQNDLLVGQINFS